MAKFVSSIFKSNVIIWLIIMVFVINCIIINNGNAQCDRVVLQGRLTNFYKSDIPSDFQCYLTVSVDKVLVGSNLIDVSGKRVEPGYVLATSWSCPTLPQIQIGDCIEMSGGWCNRDSPPIYREYNYYVRKITCPDETGPTPQCPPGPIGSTQCSGNAVRQLYQDANCNRYWQTVDDCNRYIPSKCCNNGACQKCGEQETYRCVNNVVQRLVINNGVGEWQVFDDCNRYSPPRRCIGGVCIKVDDTTPDEECDQNECQSQSGPIGIPYSIDGKTYQRYNECNCIENECSCDSVAKEVPKTEIKFLGTAVKKHMGNGAGAPDFWTVDVGSVISGPQPCNDELDVIIRQALNEVWGQVDPGIQEECQVEVYGEYQTQENGDCRVVLYGSDQYYIKRSIRIIPECSYIAGKTLSGEEASWRRSIDSYPPDGPAIYNLPQTITADVCYSHKFGSEIVTGGHKGFKASLELWNGNYRLDECSRQENEANANRDCLGGCEKTSDGRHLQVRLPEDAKKGWYDARIRLYYSQNYPLDWKFADEVEIDRAFFVE